MKKHSILTTTTNDNNDNKNDTNNNKNNNNKINNKKTTKQRKGDVINSRKDRISGVPVPKRFVFVPCNHDQSQLKFQERTEDKDEDVLWRGLKINLEFTLNYFFDPFLRLFFVRAQAIVSPSTVYCTCTVEGINNGSSSDLLFF